MTEEKAKTGHAVPKAENEKALWSLGLVHMYSALHAKGKNSTCLSIGEGMSEIRALRTDRESMSSQPQWGNGKGVLLGRCWIHPHLFVLWLKSTISPLNLLYHRNIPSKRDDFQHLLELISSAAEEESLLHGMCAGQPQEVGFSRDLGAVEFLPFMLLFELIKITEERYCVCNLANKWSETAPGTMHGWCSALQHSDRSYRLLL